MASISEVRNKLKLSALDLASPELIVFSAVYDHSDEGITEPELVRLLERPLTEKHVIRAIDILFDYGLIVPRRVARFVGEGRNRNELLVRAYFPTGEPDYNQVGKFAGLILKQLSKRREHPVVPVVFERSDCARYRELDRDLQLLNYVFFLASDGLRGLSPTFAYKMAASVWWDLTSSQKDFHSYAQIQPAPYGIVLAFPPGVLASDTYVRELTCFGYWQEKRGKIFSSFESYKDAVKSLASIGIDRSQANDATLLYMKIIEEVSPKLKKRPTELLNILATSRNPNSVGSSLSFEQSAWSNWFRLFTEGLVAQQASEKAIIGEAQIVAFLLNNLIRIAKKAQNLPNYIGRGATVPESLDGRKNIFKQIETEAKSLRFKLGTRAELNSTQLTEYRGMRNRLFEAILTQAARAALQSNKKVSDYLGDSLEVVRAVVEDLHANDPHYSLAAENLLSTLIPPSHLNTNLRSALQSLNDVTLACMHLTSLARAICPEFSRTEKNPPQYYLEELKKRIWDVPDIVDIWSQGSYDDFLQRSKILTDMFGMVNVAVEKGLLNLWDLVRQPGTDSNS